LIKELTPNCKTLKIDVSKYAKGESVFEIKSERDTYYKKIVID
jgi:hypothetical protein